MKKIIFIAAFSLFSALAYCQKATDNFIGKWKADKGIVIDITKKGNSFEGTTASKTILNNLHFEDGVWKGTLIKPEDKQQYNCTAVLDENNLKLTIKKGMFSKIIVWTK